MELIPDDIDLFVVCYIFEHNVRHTLINKAMTNIPIYRLRTRCCTGDFSFLVLAIAGIGEKVKRITCPHDAGTGQRQRNARSVDRYPATAPLFGDGGSCAGTASRVEDEVAGVGGHEETSFDDLGGSLDDVGHAHVTTCVVPIVVHLDR